MKQVIIRQSENYILTSHSNGLCYDLHHIPSDKHVFLQGDDAAQFREELECWEKYHPLKDTGEILGALYSDYSEVAQ